MSTVTAVIINYNHGHYLNKQLDAIVSQTQLPDKTIVVDDGSSDDSLAVAESYRDTIPNLKVISNGTNKGIMYSTNLGVAETDTDLVYCGCSNDLLLPSFFEKSVLSLDTYTEAALCTSDPAHFCEEWRNANNFLWTEGYLSPSDLSYAMQGGRFISGFTTVYRRSLYNEYGGLLENLKWHSDWFLNLVLAFRYGICYVNGPIAWTRWSADGYAHKGVFNWEEQKGVLDNILALLELEHMQDIRDYIRNSHAAQVLGPYSSYLANQL